MIRFRPRTSLLLLPFVLGTVAPALADQGPLVLVGMDSSAKMSLCEDASATLGAACPSAVGTNSCGSQALRLNDAKCAINNTITASPGVNFALMSYKQTAFCTGSASACSPFNVDGAGSNERSGPGDRCVLTTNGTSLACPTTGTGGQVHVGLPTVASQNTLVQGYLDNLCSTGPAGDVLPVGGGTVQGLLADAAAHLRANAASFAGSCAPISVVLIGTLEEACNGTPADNFAATVAQDLFDNGLGNGDVRKIKVYPVLTTTSAAAVTAAELIADNGQCAAGDTACRAGISAMQGTTEAQLTTLVSQLVAEINDDTAWIDDGNPCTADSCHPTNGSVVHTQLANGTPCDGGNLCTSTNRCMAGVCTPTLPVVCTPQTCKDVTCNPGTGLCEAVNQAPGTGCNDGNVCTENDECSDTQVCAGTPIMTGACAPDLMPPADLLPPPPDLTELPDLTAPPADLTVPVADLTAPPAESDLATIEPDLATTESDLATTESDLAPAESDLGELADLGEQPDVQAVDLGGKPDFELVADLDTKVDLTGTTNFGVEGGGCACRTTNGTPDASGAATLLGFVLVLVLARRTGRARGR